VDFKPCGVQYHVGCVFAGDPFTTRHKDGRIRFPPAVTRFPFVCEIFTVRANIGREMTFQSSDCWLLALERIHLIDSAHGWAESTLSDFGRHIKKLNDFCQCFEMPYFRGPAFQHHSVSGSIPLLWCMEDYTLQSSNNKKYGEVSRIKYYAARSLQSAL
jgi:hypothetical protein